MLPAVYTNMDKGKCATNMLSQHIAPGQNYYQNEGPLVYSSDC